jgi:hypothetical protein
MMSQVVFSRPSSVSVAKERSCASSTIITLQHKAGGRGGQCRANKTIGSVESAQQRVGGNKDRGQARGQAMLLHLFRKSSRVSVAYAYVHVPRLP